MKHYVKNVPGEPSEVVCLGCGEIAATLRAIPASTMTQTLVFLNGGGLPKHIESVIIERAHALRNAIREHKCGG